MPPEKAPTTDLQSIGCSLDNMVEELAGLLDQRRSMRGQLEDVLGNAVQKPLKLPPASPQIQAQPESVEPQLPPLDALEVTGFPGRLDFRQPTFPLRITNPNLVTITVRIKIIPLRNKGESFLAFQAPSINIEPGEEKEITVTMSIPNTGVLLENPEDAKADAVRIITVANAPGHRQTRFENPPISVETSFAHRHEETIHIPFDGFTTYVELPLDIQGLTFPASHKGNKAIGVTERDGRSFLPVKNPLPQDVRLTGYTGAQIPVAVDASFRLNFEFKFEKFKETFMRMVRENWPKEKVHESDESPEKILGVAEEKLQKIDDIVPVSNMLLSSLRASLRRRYDYLKGNSDVYRLRDGQRQAPRFACEKIYAVIQNVIQVINAMLPIESEYTYCLPELDTPYGGNKDARGENIGRMDIRGSAVPHYATVFWSGIGKIRKEDKSWLEEPFTVIY